MIRYRIAPAIALALASLVVGGPFAGPSDGQPSELPLKVVTLVRRGEIYRTSTSKWGPLALRAELGPGDGARALAGSRLTLRTTSGQSLRLGAQSRVFVLPGGGPDQPTQIKLESGALWVAVIPGSPPGEGIEVRTGAVTVTVRGSGVWVTLTPDGSVQVRVFHGAAECSGPGAERRWTRALPAGQELLVSAPGVPVAIKKLDPEQPQGDWTKWNLEQDVAGGYGGKPPAP